jgi:sortase A
MWDVRKSGDGNLGTGSGDSQSSNLRWASRIWAERLLLASGLALIAIYGAARIESILGSRAALRHFAVLETSANAGSRDSGQESGSSSDIDALEVDFSHWDEHRAQAYKASLVQQSSTPLGVLRISRIHLEVPILDGTDDLTLNHAVGRITGTAWPGERGKSSVTQSS